MPVFLQDNAATVSATANPEAKGSRHLLRTTAELGCAYDFNQPAVPFTETAVTSLVRVAAQREWFRSWPGCLPTTLSG